MSVKSTADLISRFSIGIHPEDHPFMRDEVGRKVREASVITEHGLGRDLEHLGNGDGDKDKDKNAESEENVKTINEEVENTDVEKVQEEDERKTNDNNAGESEAKNDTAKIEKLVVKSDQESETYLSTSTTAGDSRKRQDGTPETKEINASPPSITSNFTSAATMEKSDRLYAAELANLTGFSSFHAKKDSPTESSSNSPNTRTRLLNIATSAIARDEEQKGYGHTNGDDYEIDERQKEFGVTMKQENYRVDEDGSRNADKRVTMRNNLDRIDVSRREPDYRRYEALHGSPYRSSVSRRDDGRGDYFDQPPSPIQYSNHHQGLYDFEPDDLKSAPSSALSSSPLSRFISHPSEPIRRGNMSPTRYPQSPSERSRYVDNEDDGEYTVYDHVIRRREPDIQQQQYGYERYPRKEVVNVPSSTYRERSPERGYDAYSRRAYTMELPKKDGYVAVIRDKFMASGNADRRVSSPPSSSSELPATSYGRVSDMAARFSGEHRSIPVSTHKDYHRYSFSPTEYSTTQNRAYRDDEGSRYQEHHIQHSRPRHRHHISAGALGALFSLAVTYPLDIIKTRLQVQSKSLSSSTPYYDSTFDAIQQIVKSEGLLGLYTGLPAGLIGVASTNFAYFYWYSFIRTRYQRRYPTISTAAELLLSALAAILAQIFTIPVSVVTTRQQTADKEERRDLLGTAEEIISEDGITGLWKGLKPSMVLCVNPAITYGMFERLKSIGSKDGDLSPRMAFLLGALSKTIATVVTYPYIMAKVRLQWKLPKSSVEKLEDEIELEESDYEDRSTEKRKGVISKKQDVRYNGAIDVLKKVWIADGFFGWYKGMQAQITKAVLSQALLFWVKEYTTKYTILLFALFARLAVNRRVTSQKT
ncbi:10945_t:CDS:2 [Paraglomus brasilianum]|uniref:10945_t:CDS:1 n=1 Tax=Paraglomus brasilianum TaxID=144538 RepID=A0A9N8ZIL4_9GLOM|nr:10945_t:CDS:2 [Paraglomus brasilianum]